jgi:hypothetical protein
MIDNQYNFNVVRSFVAAEWTMLRNLMMLGASAGRAKFFIR